MDRKHQAQERAKRVRAGEHPGVVLAPEPDGRSVATRLCADRHCRIAVRAYFMAEARGFAPGGALDDWLAAEIEEDAAARPF